MLNRRFQKFRGGPADKFNSSVTARVTINPRGMIYFNDKMYQDMGKPTAVSLYYDPTSDSIAFQPDGDRTNENFPVIKKQSGWAVHASTFCRHFRIRVRETKQFLHPHFDKRHNLIVCLGETILIGGIERKPRNSSSSDLAK